MSTLVTVLGTIAIVLIVSGMSSGAMFSRSTGTRTFGSAAALSTVVLALGRESVVLVPVFTLALVASALLYVASLGGEREGR